MPTAHTPLPWKVRKHPHLGCFIEARIPGKPYGQEIMGDDYFPDLSREADAEFIVKCVTEVSALRAALVEHRDCKGIYVREVGGQLQLACCARTHGGAAPVLFSIP